MTEEFLSNKIPELIKNSDLKIDDIKTRQEIVEVIGHEFEKLYQTQFDNPNFLSEDGDFGSFPEHLKCLREIQSAAEGNDFLIDLKHIFSDYAEVYSGVGEDILKKILSEIESSLKELSTREISETNFERNEGAKIIRLFNK